MAANRNVKFTQPEVPSFLKKFKERIGYKEPANVNDKFATDAEDSESKSTVEDEVRQGEDEQPVIVVLKEGDMTAEQVDEYKKEDGEECWDFKKDKPVFKKPVKRPSSDKKDTKNSHKKKKTNVKVKPVTNNKLLSFNEDDDEES